MKKGPLGDLFRFVKLVGHRILVIFVFEKQVLTTQVSQVNLSNNNQIKAVKQAIDRLVYPRRWLKSLAKLELFILQYEKDIIDGCGRLDGDVLQWR